MAMNVKKGDTVVVLSGKDKGKQGKVQGLSLIHISEPTRRS